MIERGGLVAAGLLEHERQEDGGDQHVAPVLGAEADAMGLYEVEVEQAAGGEQDRDIDDPQQIGKQPDRLGAQPTLARGLRKPQQPHDIEDALRHSNRLPEGP